MIAELAILLVLVGALNWLTIGAYDLDLVEKATMGQTAVQKGIYIAVGVAAVGVIASLYSGSIRLVVA